MITSLFSNFKFFPSEKLTITTQKSIDELIQNLSSVLSFERTFMDKFLRRKTDKKYEGQINGSHFEIKRIIYYRNSFLPIITGTFEDTFDCTKVHIEMRMSDFVKAFLFLWFSVVLSVFFGFLANSILTSEFHFLILIPFGMFSLFYGVIFLAFKFESRKSIQDLNEIFSHSKLDLTLDQTSP
jgi:hypothetical protein